MSKYPSVYRLIDTMRELLAGQPELADMFARCFPNTLETTVTTLEDGTTFVMTGDIPAMWLRDSSAQVFPYLALAAEDEDLQRLFRGVIKRQASFLLLDPYANAFAREPGSSDHREDLPQPDPLIWERKYELDSLCYPVHLWYHYWKRTLDASIFDDTLHRAFICILDTMQVEQHHDVHSPYTFIRPNPLQPTDTLVFQGRGTRTNMTGMIWSGFRPSDDACTFGFLIPANMFATVILHSMAEIAQVCYQDEQLAQRAQQLRSEILFGIETYGVVHHPEFGRIYAYETDGFGNYVLMDDANVPSLLSIPYLGYRPVGDPLYQQTRRFILSPDNPYYFQGRAGVGIGSPHTPHMQIWPIALSMQGLTTQHPEEQQHLLHMLMKTTAGTGFMHESFHADDPQIFTRSWFAWANSLFAEFVLHLYKPDLSM